MTLRLLPPSRRHVIWRDSVGVGVLGKGLNQSVLVIFQQSFSVCYAILMSYNNSETADYGYNPALFGVLSLSYSCLAKLIFT